MALKFAKAPRLPAPSPVYSPDMLDQFQNVLLLYFNQIDSSFSTILGPQGGRYFSIPYGAFSDSTTQTVAANTAQAVTFNTSDYVNGVSVVTNSKITVTVPGIYNLQFSAQLQNTDAALQDASVWLRKNGADVAGSLGRVSVPGVHSAVNGNTIASWNYFVQLAGNDYVELWWSNTNTAVTIQTYAAGTSPTRPTTASVISTLSFVSAIPE
jgi:hypothetical protein